MNETKIKELVGDLIDDLESLSYDIETIKQEWLEKNLLEMTVKFGQIVNEILGRGSVGEKEETA